ncbi:MAG: phosphoribosylglycinamide formyltransferase [Cyclobacteriaceae bacterium]
MGKNIAIFASGSGSNAENIILSQYCTDLTVKAIFCTNPKAFVIERAKKLDVPCVVFSREEFKSEDFLKTLADIDYIILAGFLWKIPQYLVNAFPREIINIHPALLPKFGGKGMYGSHVHEAVVAKGETESGITIHVVNENYDEGQIIFQAKCPVTSTDTPDTVAEKVHQLEYDHFPQIIAQYIENQG